VIQSPPTRTKTRDIQKYRLSLFTPPAGKLEYKIPSWEGCPKGGVGKSPQLKQKI
jgi:hypothetical protein